VIDPSTELPVEYGTALRTYLDRRDEADLQRAYELGRVALVNGVGILDLAMIHHEALASALSGGNDQEDTAALTQRSAGFLVETLSPFEMTHRGFRESAIALRHLYERVEAEVKRIAHALHDDAGQLLASIYLALREVDAETTPAGRLELKRINQLLGEVETQLRRLAHELRPTVLDDLGLLPALEFLADGVALRTGITTTVEGSTEGEVPLLVETAMYRIAQEALANVVRHARATRVTIRLWREVGRLRCRIRDDGTGFDVEEALNRRQAGHGMGLHGIQERVAALGGTLQINSRPGVGTELDVSILLEGSNGAAAASGG
jgi:signal transduction histidine kinase